MVVCIDFYGLIDEIDNVLFNSYRLNTLGSAVTPEQRENWDTANSLLTVSLLDKDHNVECRSYL